MWKYTLKVDGMMCGMCEAHSNDAVRKAFNVKKVTSSHTKGETVVISEEEISDQAFRECFAPTGYKLGEIKKEPYKKKFLFF